MTARKRRKEVSCKKKVWVSHEGRATYRSSMSCDVSNSQKNARRMGNLTKSQIKQKPKNSRQFILAAIVFFLTMTKINQQS